MPLSKKGKMTYMAKEANDVGGGYSEKHSEKGYTHLPLLQIRNTTYPTIPIMKKATPHFVHIVPAK